jgi:hypothetical protein
VSPGSLPYRDLASTRSPLHAEAQSSPNAHAPGPRRTWGGKFPGKVAVGRSSVYGIALQHRFGVALTGNCNSPAVKPCSARLTRRAKPSRQSSDKSCGSCTALCHMGGDESRPFDGVFHAHVAAQGGQLPSNPALTLPHQPSFRPSPALRIAMAIGCAGALEGACGRLELKLPKTPTSADSFQFEVHSTPRTRPPRQFTGLARPLQVPCQIDAPVCRHATEREHVSPSQWSCQGFR